MDANLAYVCRLTEVVIYDDPQQIIRELGNDRSTSTINGQSLKIGLCSAVIALLDINRFCSTLLVTTKNGVSTSILSK